MCLPIATDCPSPKGNCGNFATATGVKRENLKKGYTEINRNSDAQKSSFNLVISFQTKNLNKHLNIYKFRADVINFFVLSPLFIL